MTEEVRQRCLEPFYSTKGERGTGLGLAIVYGIVQRHGGSLDIQSEVGKGTTFRLRLPIHTGQPAPVTQSEMKGSSKPLSVLVVEDDPALLEIEAEYLSSEGHTIETATDGCEGLKKFRKGRFDLVVVDRAMPNMNGDQMSAAINNFPPALRSSW